jgi:Arc/MetJ-type ribon-helix-helix transcriptional regulator
MLLLKGKSMSADLSPDIESFIQQEIALGTFQSREDALEAGVALLRTRRELMNRLAESRRQLDEGEYIEYDDEGLRQFFEQLIARAEGKSQQQ